MTLPEAAVPSVVAVLSTLPAGAHVTLATLTHHRAGQLPGSAGTLLGSLV